MLKPKVLVTGATGRTGRIVVRELLAAGFPVRAMVRAADARSEALERQGVEIAVADMGDPERVAVALRGVQRAYFLPHFEAAALYGAAVFATASKDAGLEHIVLMSQWLASASHPALSTRQHWLTDRLFAMNSSAGPTIVNPGFFADMPYLTVMPYAAHLGIYPWLFGEGRNAPPSVDDIGRVAAAALMNPDRHAGQVYRPTGPELLGRTEIVGTVGRVLGRKVRAAPMPLWMFLRAAKLDGLPIQLLSSLGHYFEEHRRGAFEAGAPTDHVRQVTGRAPESFETVARRHALLPENQRTVGNFAKRFAKFMAVPLTPGPRTSAYLAGLHMPQPEKPLLSLDSGVWRAEHVIAATGSTTRPDPLLGGGRANPAVAVATTY